MQVDTPDFFSQYGKLVKPQPIVQHASIPFIEHPQFQYLIDVLARKDHHHCSLVAGFSTAFHLHYIQALTLHLASDHAPAHLRQVDVLHIDLHDVPPQLLTKLTLNHEHFDKPRIISIANAEPRFIDQHLLPFLANANARIILFTKPIQQQFRYLQNDFHVIELTAPSEKDKLAILKSKRHEFEQFHHVSIPDDVLATAYQLAERFLSANDALIKSLQLLDSAAARAARQSTEQNKPIVCADMLSRVIATWTQIPTSSTQLHQFKLSEFSQQMRQTIFGQDIAITMFGHALQQAHARLRQNLGPFCSFLLAGPEHSGKKSAAIALVELLYKQLNVLYFAQPFTNDTKSILDVKLQRCHDKHYATLKDVIQDTPYAVIFFNNIDTAPQTVIDNLHLLFATGHLHDEDGNDYNFRQSIIMLSTTLGSSYLRAATASTTKSDEDEPVDLMQLILNEQKQTGTSQRTRYSSQELVEGLMPIITPFLPESFCQHLHVVPFLPLDKPAIEKIIHLRLKRLDKQLETKHGIELTYAHEVVRHLANEVINAQSPKSHIVDIDKTLRQLYFCIEHAIFSQTDNPNKPTQLVLQLNETGQLLRCDWLMTQSSSEHVG